MAFLTEPDDGMFLHFEKHDHPKEEDHRPVQFRYPVASSGTASVINNNSVRANIRNGNS